MQTNILYHYDGFHHLKMVETEKATNEIVDYNNINDLVNHLTPAICDHLLSLGVIPASLEAGITASTEADFNTAYVEAVSKWVAENIDLFLANLELAITPTGYIARKYVATSDNWRPTVQLRGRGFVMVRFMQLTPNPKSGYRIAVYGNDDFGLEFDSKDLLTAEALYKELTEASDLTVQSLLDKGFARV